MRPIVVCVVAMGAMAIAARGEAFCRTTTVQVPVDFNPAVSGGCWTQGTPLYWPMSRVPYGVAEAGSAAQSITGAQATVVADLAFGAWNNAACEGGAPSVEAFDDGPIASVPEASDCTDSNSCDPVVHDVIVFDDGGWPYTDDTTSTIALTTVSYGMDDGRIFEAKTEVNSANQPLTIEEPPPLGSNAYDLQAVFTHEAGHFLGLAHAAETTSIMYAYYQAGAIQLTPDDVSGICAIYPPGGSTHDSSGLRCSFRPLRAHSDSSAALAALVVLCACAAARRARSRGSQEGHDA